MPDYVEDGNTESRSDFLQDLLIAHQVGILRVANGTTRSVVRNMNEIEDQFMAKLIFEIQRLGAINAGNYIQKQPKVERVIRELSRERMQSWQESKSLINKEMVALALWEATWQTNALRKTFRGKLTNVADVAVPLQEFSFPSSAAERLVK